MSLEHCPAIALQTDPTCLGEWTSPATTSSLAFPPKDGKAQQGYEGSWPEETRIPCPSLDPHFFPDPPLSAHVIPARANVSNGSKSSQGTASAMGFGHLERDTASPLARGMSEKKEWGFFVLVFF